MDDTARAFQQKKYAALAQLITGPLRSSLYRYALKRAQVAPGVMERMNPDGPLTATAYGDPMMDILLANLTPKVERATGLKLYPTFSFYRVYQRGDVLGKHTDRASCEIALTLNLGQDAGRPWPLWVEGPQGISSVSLESGDALVYRGIDCPHWREPFDGDRAAQVFLFWVDQNGPYAEWKFDKRERLSSFLNPGGRFAIRPDRIPR